MRLIHSGLSKLGPLLVLCKFWKDFSMQLPHQVVCWLSGLFTLHTLGLALSHRPTDLCNSFSAELFYLVLHPTNSSCLSSLNFDLICQPSQMIPGLLGLSLSARHLRGAHRQKAQSIAGFTSFLPFSCVPQFCVSCCPVSESIYYTYFSVLQLPIVGRQVELQSLPHSWKHNN